MFSTTQPRAVVTGGAGFIGSHIADRLIELGYDVLVVDDLSTGSRANVPQAAHLEDLDVADPAVERLLGQWRPAVIVHCAAQVSVASSVLDPARDARSNVLGTIGTVRAAVQANARASSTSPREERCMVSRATFRATKSTRSSRSVRTV